MLLRRSLPHVMVLVVTVAIPSLVTLLVATRIGSYSVARDVLCTAFALAAFSAKSRRLVQASKAAGPAVRTWAALLLHASLVAGGTILLTWASTSFLDVALTTRTSEIPTRTAPERAIGPHVTLSLSGGGYRAALFHAGVIDRLEELRVPVAAISSVSGGSIIASYYSSGGKPSTFVRLVSAGRFDLTREIFHIHTLARLVISLIASSIFTTPPEWLRFTRLDVQAELLDRLLLRGRRGIPSSPELMLCTADLASGNLIGLGSRGIIQQPIASPARRLGFANYDADPSLQWPTFVPYEELRRPLDTRLAELVAASGAFPGAINPLLLDVRSEWSLAPFVLADGGLGDNLGLDLARAAYDLAWWSKVRNKKALARYVGVESTMNTIRPVHWPLASWRADLMVVSDGSKLSSAYAPTSFGASLARALDFVYSATSGSAVPPVRLRESAAKRAQRSSVWNELGVDFPPALWLSPATFTGEIPLQIFDEPTLWTLVRAHFLENLSAVSGRSADSFVITDDDEDPVVAFRRALEQIAPGRTLFALEREIRRGTHAEADSYERGLPSIDTLRRDCLHALIQVGRGAARRHLAACGNMEVDHLLIQLMTPLSLDITQKLKVFLETSTLRDQVSASDARDIFSLGRYVAIAHEQRILGRLRAAAAPN